MKKSIMILMIVLIAISVIACNENATEDSTEIHVGVSFYPMKEILELVEEDLNNEGFELVVHEFSDFQVPNNLLMNKELDANMIQHEYFMESFNQANNGDLVRVMPIYHATFALYAKEFDSPEQIPEGTTITLPDDATNLSRSLYLLSQAGLLTLNNDRGTGLTLEDIDENPKNLNLKDQVPLTSLAQRYIETGVAIMYPTFARSLELEGEEQRIFVEEQDEVTEGYAISLVSRSDNKESDGVKALSRHLRGDKVRTFLIDEYSWASKPAF